MVNRTLLSNDRELLHLSIKLRIMARATVIVLGQFRLVRFFGVQNLFALLTTSCET